MILLEGNKFYKIGHCSGDGGFVPLMLLNVKKVGQPWPLLSFIFGLFKQTSLQILQQIDVKKCPSSIRCLDSNSRPLEHESLPITTRPGLPHNVT